MSDRDSAVDEVPAEQQLRSGIGQLLHRNGQGVGETARLTSSTWDSLHPIFSTPIDFNPARLKVQSGCMCEGVTDGLLVKVPRYDPKALYSGGDS